MSAPEITTKGQAFGQWLKETHRDKDINAQNFEEFMRKFEREHPEFEGGIVPVNGGLAVVVESHEGGPKMIGEIQRQVVEHGRAGMVAVVAEAATILKSKYGERGFQNDLGRKIKQDFVKLTMAPAGSHVFIADSAATIAFRKDADGMTIEVRLPGKPYQRGRISATQTLKLFGINLGEE